MEVLSSPDSTMSFEGLQIISYNGQEVFDYTSFIEEPYDVDNMNQDFMVFEEEEWNRYLRDLSAISDLSMNDTIVLHFL